MPSAPAAPIARNAGWAAPAVALGLAATVLGLSRFGYGVLLPAMRAELGWTYAQAGLLDTANAVGYLAGALVCPVLMSRAGPATALRICAAVATGSLFGCAATGSLPVLLALRGIGGAAAAALFVAGGLLAARLATAAGRPGPVLGVYYAGVGPGILLTALLAPAVLTDPGRWRFGWLLLGALAAACAAIAGRAAVRFPAPSPAPRAAAPSSRRLGWALTAFTLFGVGYVPYATFAVAYWHQSSTGVATVTAMWALLAAAATASGWAWRKLLTRPEYALVVMLAVVTTAVTLPLASTTTLVLAVSAALFGGAFLAVSAATTALIRQSRPQADWPRTLTGFTAAFGAGQVAGPVLTGQLADHVGLRGGLAAAAALLALATAAAALQRSQHHGEDQSVTAEPGATVAANLEPTQG
ncbi:MAG: YbfB/YjiJ family MFS transporter [Carbonactinosporaceae bacterium]